MDWTKPEYSKRSIDAAGRTLVAQGPLFVDEFVNALQVVNNWRSSHAFPLNTMQVNLRRKSSEITDKSFVAQRIKRRSSIEHKLERYETLNLSQMQDIGGCRAVLSTVGQVERLVDIYKGSNIKHRLVHDVDYIVHPKDSGYRSRHLIYRYYSDRNETYNDLKIEIQLRSARQHAWATAVETVGTFTRQALKSSQGEEDWLRFFALMGTVIASRENRPTVPNTPANMNVLKDELKDHVNRLEIVNRLQAFSRTVQITYERELRKHNQYFLLQLDSKNTRLSITAFPKQEIELATMAYSSAEEEASGGNAGDVVLVSAESLDGLRRAYPNYFLDTSLFLREVRSFLRNG